MSSTDAEIARAALALTQNVLFMLIQKKVFTTFEANEIFQKAVQLPFAPGTQLTQNGGSAQLLRDTRDAFAKFLTDMDAQSNAPQRQ